MVTASLANRLHRLGAQPIVGRDQCMHGRFGDPALFGDVFGRSLSHQGRVDNEPPLAIQSRLRRFHALLDLFRRQVGGCTCDPCHAPSACAQSREFGRSSFASERGRAPSQSRLLLGRQQESR
jgi:hypothetical protein